MGLGFRMSGFEGPGALTPGVRNLLFWSVGGPQQRSHYIIIPNVRTPDKTAMHGFGV